MIFKIVVIILLLVLIILEIDRLKTVKSIQKKFINLDVIDMAEINAEYVKKHWNKGNNKNE